MRIGIDVRDRKLAKTGIKTVLDEIVAELQNQNREVVLLSPKRVKKPEGKIDKILEHINFFLWKELILPILAWKNKCDVLLCNDYVGPFVTLGVKTFPFFHGTNFWEHKNHYNSLWRRYFSVLALAGTKSSTRVIVNSKFTSDKVNILLKIPAHKIEILPLGGKSFNGSNDKDLLLNWKLMKQDYILHVGVFEKRKNLVNLIRAFSLLENSDLKLVLVGQPGPKADMDDSLNIQNEIESLNLNDRVVLPGHVNEDQLNCIYENASIYVFPSIYEGFGIPALEAFSHKVPVISSNYGALPEVVGPDGLYFDPLDPHDMKQSILKVMNNPALQEQLIENGIKRLEIYNWESACNRLIEIFASDKNHASEK